MTLLAPIIVGACLSMVSSFKAPVDDLVSYVKRKYPEAEIQRDERYGDITIRWKTKEWVSTSGGDLAGARRNIGPVEDGFILWLSSQKGPYTGVGKRPQIMIERSWKLYIGLMQNPERTEYCLVNLSFTDRTDRTLVEYVQDVVRKNDGK
jgi:hypothetical protein